MSGDIAQAADRMSVGVGAALADAVRGTTHWLVERWDAEQTAWAVRKSGLVAPQGIDLARLGLKPYAVSEVMGNLITNAGWTRLMNLLTNQGATQALDSTHTRIGVGDSTTAEAYTDTNLIGTNKWFQPVSGVATLGTRTLAYSATFGTADGNYAWNEFGLDATVATATAGATIGALLFNRKAGIAQGTKASGQTWTATATITFT